MKEKEKIPEIAVIGLNHKTAPVELREEFSFEDDVVSEFMHICGKKGIDEIVFVSTCNRMEIYFATSDIHQSSENIISLLETYSNLKRNDFEKSLYRKYSRDAAHHLLTVASSLDSMVIGENEIISQVKAAYQRAVSLKNTGPLLNRLFHQAFNTAKKVRTETEISQNPLSIAYIATELAKKIFEDLSTRKALLIGAGEMGELILKYFTKNSISEITIANRSIHNAEKIADEINREAHIVLLNDIDTIAPDVDIIISSAAAQDYIITKDMAFNIMNKKGNRPLFMIDISVPRNIDPEVAGLNNIFLYNIDDLKSIADENLRNRLNEVDLAQNIIESDANDFTEWYDELTIVPTIITVRNILDDIRKNELNKYRRRKMKHLTKKDFSLVEDLTMQIMTKTLHNPIMTLKKYQMLRRGENYKKGTVKEKLKTIEELFGKDE